MAKLDPVTLRVLGQAALPDRVGPYAAVPIAATGPAVYAIVPGAVIRFDSRTLKMRASSSPGGDSLAAGGGALWMVRHGADLYRLIAIGQNSHVGRKEFFARNLHHGPEHAPVANAPFAELRFDHSAAFGLPIGNHGDLTSIIAVWPIRSRSSPGTASVPK